MSEDPTSVEWVRSTTRSILAREPNDLGFIAANLLAGEFPKLLAMIEELVAEVKWLRAPAPADANVDEVGLLQAAAMLEAHARDLEAEEDNDRADTFFYRREVEKAAALLREKAGPRPL